MKTIIACRDVGDNRIKRGRLWVGECEKKDEKDRGLGEELRCDVPKFQIGFNLII